VKRHPEVPQEQLDRHAAKMMIIVPTRGRVNYQHTVRNLPEWWRKNRTIIVCPANEVKAHMKNHEVKSMWGQPAFIKTIAAKRAWIFQIAQNEGYDKILMLDDDLRFSVRAKEAKSFAGYGGRGGSEWKQYVEKHPGIQGLVNIGPKDKRLSTMLTRVEQMLNQYAHGGISPRQMNQTFSHEFTMNVRAIYALAYHVPTVMEHCELGRIETREDIDYTLQLMRKGFDNAVYTWGVVEQARGYGAEGGVGDDRSVKSSNADAVKLAKLHPGLVKVVDKAYKVSIPRKEVIVYWQKAIAEGRTMEFM